MTLYRESCDKAYAKVFVAAEPGDIIVPERFICSQAIPIYEDDPEGFGSVNCEVNGKRCAIYNALARRIREGRKRQPWETKEERLEETVEQ